MPCAQWVRDNIRWTPTEHPNKYQYEAMEVLEANRRLAIRGPHALGKTALAAWIVLWFFAENERLASDWKAPTTASVWRQLTKYLWPEIHKWARRVRWDKLKMKPPYHKGGGLLMCELGGTFGSAFAVASSDNEKIEGAHASHLLYVLDEAKAIPDRMWDSVEGAFAQVGDVYCFAMSTPGDPIGRFYDIHKRRPGFEDWTARHVTKDEAIAAGRLDPEWAEQRRAQWGDRSAVYLNRVLGEFASSDEEGIIPLAHVELAMDRWKEVADSGGFSTEFTCAGVDVARFGADTTVVGLRFGNAVTEIRRHSREDTMQTAGRVSGILQANGGYAVVDVIGVGAGVVDRLRELGQNVVPFNAGEGTDFRDSSGELGFVNARAAAWWNLREMLDPANGHCLALPPDDELIGDLTAPTYRQSSGGRMQVESKDDIKRRLGRSPDVGDAVVMAFWPVTTGFHISVVRR